MNYEMYIKEGHHLKTLHKLITLTKEKRISEQRDLIYFIGGDGGEPDFEEFKTFLLYSKNLQLDCDKNDKP